MRKVIPFLKVEYFKESAERTLFTQIASFIEKYKNTPTYEALVIDLTEAPSLKEEQVRDAVDLLKTIHADRKEPSDIAWLTNQTEKFCKDSALYNAVLEAVQLMDDTNKDRKKPKEAIPDLLTQALAVSFDPHVGHDYLSDAERRYDYYHQKEKKISFDIDFLNKITNGGFSTKTLNIILAGTNVGKSLVMCHLAANALSQGKHVLYITLEMAEERIAERIDVNLLNVPFDDLQKLGKQEFDKKFAYLRSKTHGKLIIKEYPTAGASVMHFRSLLTELALKKSFKPDIIFVDYLNLCLSSRIKMGNSVNSYTYVKSVAEELRGLAVEYEVPLVSATQTTRGGFDNSDLELTDTSESFGLPATADFFVAVVMTEELEKLNQYMFKQLKNRYMGKTVNKRFVVGVDMTKMRLYNVSQNAQTLQDSGQVPDATQPEPAKKPFERKLTTKQVQKFKF